MDKQLLLYFTDGCHLCDDAQSLLEQLNIPYLKVDIIHQQRLVDLYADSIPVLEDENSNTLSWPFNLQSLNDFIDN